MFDGRQSNQRTAVREERVHQTGDNAAVTGNNLCTSCLAFCFLVESQPETMSVYRASAMGDAIASRRAQWNV
jgi:hypothetical protein